MEDTDQHRDKRARLDHDGDEDMSRMEIDSTTQPTNHDRQDSRDTDGQQGQTSGFTDATSQAAMQQQKDLGEPFLLRRSSKTLRVLLLLLFSGVRWSLMINPFDLQKSALKVLTLSNIS